MTKDGHGSVLVKRSPVDHRPPNLRGLSPAALRELGDELHRLIVADHPLRDDRALIKRLEQVNQALAGSRTRERDPIRFHVLDSDGINAFSHIGGHIYVSRSIFALVQADQELQFAVAHELAHLDLGHAAARLEQVAQAPGVEAGLVPWLHFLIALGYSEDQEYAADTSAYQALRRAGRTHREAVSFLRRYADYADIHDLGAGRRPPKSRPGDSRQDIQNHYPAHPPARERLKRLEPQTIPKNSK
jgi:predicted Zn-dependent protease